MMNMPMQGGLAAMISQAGGGDDVVEAATQIEGMPGGMELLTSYAAEEMMKAQGIPKKEAKKIRLFRMGGYASANPYDRNDKRYAEWNRKYVEPGGNGDIPGLQRGGDVRRAAEKTRRAGRGDDEILLHMSPEEAEVIEAMWGAPMINPRTGIGEYGFLSKVWKKVKKGVKKVFKSKAFQIIAPIALSIFAPGIGTAIGMKLGLSGAAASIAGNALVQGGLGALSGGKEGFKRGLITGGLGAAAGAFGKGVGESIGLSGKTADVVGSALVRGGGEALTGGDFTSGAITGGLGALSRGTQDQMSKDVRRTMGLKPAEETRIGKYIASKEAAAAAGVPDAQVDEAVAPEEVLAETAAPVTTTPVTGEVTPGTPPDMAGVPGVPPPEITPSVEVQEPPLTLPQLASKYALPAGMAALGAMGAGAGEYEQEPPPWAQQQDEGFGESLPVYTMNRQFRGLSDPSAYFTYGQPGAAQSGQALFLRPEPFGDERGTPTAPPSGLDAVTGAPGGPQPVPARSGRAGLIQRAAMQAKGWTLDPASNMWVPPQGGQQTMTGRTAIVARGGYMGSPVSQSDYWTQNADVPNAIPTVSRRGGHHVKGPGTGRSDDIPALLSDGEYVIDAESVALLGDGSGDEGARRLDEMRRNLREHKGEKLSKGGFSHKAKQPADYMRNVRKLKRTAKYEHGGLHNVAGTSPVPPVRAQGRNI